MMHELTTNINIQNLINFMKQLKQLTLGIAATCLLFSCKKEGSNSKPNPDSLGYKTDNTYQQRKETSDILVLQTNDGKVISASGYNGMVRINTDGSLDNSFHADVSVSSSDIYYSALAIQPDGKILVAANKGSSHTGLGIVRLNADGTKDNSFTTPALIKVISDILLLPNGDILVCGEFSYTEGGNYYNNLARLKPNGTIDYSFKSRLSVTATVSALALANDNSVIVSGRFSIAWTSKTGYAFIKINSQDGAVNTDFILDKQLWATVVNAGGVFYEVGADKIIPQPDGKYLISGDFAFIGGKSGNESSYPGLARLNSDGSLDASFKPEEGGEISLLSDGNVVIGKASRIVGNELDVFFSVLDNTGKLKSPLSNLGFDEGSVRSILKVSDNEFILGGIFYKGSDRYGTIKVKK